MSRKPRVGIIGLGFVGLTTGLGFVHFGFKVSAFDVAPARMAQLATGEIGFHEPGLAPVLAEHLGGRFRLAASFAEVVQSSDIVVFCVGTPQSDDGSVDLRYLRTALQDALALHEPGRFRTLVIKSTVPPGSAVQELVPLVEAAGLEIGRDLGFANNPEFLREGCAWQDFTAPDRIVVGLEDEASLAALSQLYADFPTELYVVSLSTAEFIKSTSNTLLATLISFANECSIIADKIGGIDLPSAFAALHRDRRWSGQPAGMASYFFPGCGFGGYCLPKDAAAFAAVAARHGHEPEITRSVIRVNSAIAEHFVGKIVAASNPLSRIGLLGLAFKPGSDDVRGTPVVPLIELLIQQDRQNLVAYDPMAMPAFRRGYNLPIDYATSLEDLAAQCDVLVLTVGWPEFREKAALFEGKPLLDGRYFLSRA